MEYKLTKSENEALLKELDREDIQHFKEMPHLPVICKRKGINFDYVVEYDWEHGVIITFEPWYDGIRYYTRTVETDEGPRFETLRVRCHKPTLGDVMIWHKLFINGEAQNDGDTIEVQQPEEGPCDFMMPGFEPCGKDGKLNKVWGGCLCPEHDAYITEKLRRATL